jgi:hypothetical protein
LFFDTHQRLGYNIVNMPTDSFYPSFEVPDVGIWDFLFERKDRDFPDDKGEHGLKHLLKHSTV